MIAQLIVTFVARKELPARGALIRDNIVIRVPVCAAATLISVDPVDIWMGHRN